MMINNWRVTSDVVFMIENTGSGNKVYIASPEKRQYEVAVSKLCKSCYATETIDNEDFEIKVDTEESNPYLPILYVKTPQLPKLGWVRVGNFYTPAIWNIVSQCKSNYGEFSGKFKIVFTESEPNVVSFISPDMLEYKEAVEEMKRRVRCEIGKKTKSLKPGHRYDLLKETRYYLCDVVSRKRSNCSSDFQIDTFTSETKAYIYTNRILDSDKSVSDVLRDRKFGPGLYDLKVAISSSSSWIDSGLKLNNDFTGNIKDYWESIVDNTSKAGLNIVRDSSDYQIYTNIADIFEVFSCQSKDDLSYKISDSLLTKINDIISRTIEFNLLINWNLKVSDKNLEIGDKKEYDKNAEALEKLLYKFIDDGNINKFSYYRSMFSALGLDIKKKCEIIAAGFNPNDLSSSFDNYLKYKFYWKNKKYLYSTSLTKTILDYNFDKIKDTGASIDNLFGKSELSQVIRDMFNYAKDNYGSGVSNYVVNNTSRKGANLVVFCRITLDDILKFKKGASELSETLKNEIVMNKFDTICINCKESDVL